MPVVSVELACTPKCRSNAHYLDLIRVASQSLPIPVILNYLCRCGNCGRGRWCSPSNGSTKTPSSMFLGHDKFGRTLVQVCSALPEKWPVIDWLLKQKKVDINLKNVESGYTVRCFNRGSPFRKKTHRDCWLFIVSSRHCITVCSMGV